MRTDDEFERVRAVVAADQLVLLHQREQVQHVLVRVLLPDRVELRVVPPDDALQLRRPRVHLLRVLLESV